MQINLGSLTGSTPLFALLHLLLLHTQHNNSPGVKGSKTHTDTPSEMPNTEGTTEMFPREDRCHLLQYKCSPRKTDVMYFYCNTIKVTATFVYTLTSVPGMNCVSQMYQVHKDSLWMTAVTSTWQTGVWVHNSTPPRETDATCLQTIGNKLTQGHSCPSPSLWALTGVPRRYKKGPLRAPLLSPRV